MHRTKGLGGGDRGAHVKQGEDFDQALLGGKEDPGKVTETYKQKMALQAPVQYWKDKKTIYHDREPKNSAYVPVSYKSCDVLHVSLRRNQFKGLTVFP